jgi:hypothetical protein
MARCCANMTFAADHIIDAQLKDVQGTILDRASMGENLFRPFEPVRKHLWSCCCLEDRIGPNSTNCDILQCHCNFGKKCNKTRSSVAICCRQVS